MWLELAAKCRAAVNVERRAADIAAGGRSQKHGGVRHFFRFRQAAERVLVQRFLPAAIIAIGRQRPPLGECDGAIGPRARWMMPKTRTPQSTDFPPMAPVKAINDALPAAPQE